MSGVNSIPFLLKTQYDSQRCGWKACYIHTWSTTTDSGLNVCGKNSILKELKDLGSSLVPCLWMQLCTQEHREGRNLNAYFYFPFFPRSFLFVLPSWFWDIKSTVLLISLLRLNILLKTLVQDCSYWWAFHFIIVIVVLVFPLSQALSQHLRLHKVILIKVRNKGLWIQWIIVLLSSRKNMHRVLLHWTRAGEGLLCSKISGQWLCPHFFWGADSGSSAGQPCHHPQLVGAGQERSFPLSPPLPAQESPPQVGSFEDSHKLCLCSELALHKCMVHAPGFPAQPRDANWKQKR